MPAKPTASPPFGLFSPDSPAETGEAQEQEQEARPTPMLAQYFKVKETHPDCLIFFRMGDFFELFFEDAEIAAPILQIQLTHRGSHKGKPVLMCGVPARAVESYLARLIREGHRVALCDQVEGAEQAKRRGGKQVVRREVVCLVTPGTLLEDSLLEARRNNHLVALARERGTWGVAWADISTGGFFTRKFAAKQSEMAKLAGLLVRLEASEILIARNLLPQENSPQENSPQEESATNKKDALLTLSPALVRDWQKHFTLLEDSQVSAKAGERRLSAHFKTSDLSAFGDFTRPELAAAGALLDYALATSAISNKHGGSLLRPPTPEAESDTLQMDAATRRNLELVRGANGTRAGSLLACLDRTTTAGGARLLNAWLSAPLTDLDAISARQDLVAWFLPQSTLTSKLCESLKQLPDLERAVARLGSGRGGPRDLAAVAAGLCQAQQIAERLSNAESTEPLPALGKQAIDRLAVLEELSDALKRAVIDNPPLAVRDGDFVRQGYDPRLDSLRSLRDDGARQIAVLQEKYVRASGVASLRVRHNRILGYYIEVPVSQAEKFSLFTKSFDKPISDAQQDAQQDYFRHRQTMANAVRYGSLALEQLERDLTQAEARVASLQEEIFSLLTEAVRTETQTLAGVASAVAETDCLLSFALIARAENWVRPLVEDSRVFLVAQARHPVVESARQAEDQPFVANDCALQDGQRLWLLTGPNMAGKSTFLRQNALLVVLAQAGAFVPAKSLRLGRVRRLFSRVGAADDLARGRSTFMAEMLETATILNLACPEDFIILDELGRGTATHDGLSLAWATLEHLHHQSGARTLFATHYHELTKLAEDLPHCYAATMAVREWQGEIIFLHKVRAGVAEGSYGLHVAALAGVPQPVLTRAAGLLADFEAGKIPKVALQTAPVIAKQVSPALRALLDLAPDSLSPKDALDALYALQSLARDEEEPPE